MYFLFFFTISLGFDFELPQVGSEGNPTSGMQKHTLDKRFNSAENLQQRTGRRGVKRSKRTNRGGAE